MNAFVDLRVRDLCYGYDYASVHSDVTTWDQTCPDFDFDPCVDDDICPSMT